MITPRRKFVLILIGITVLVVGLYWSLQKNNRSRPIFPTTISQRPNAGGLPYAYQSDSFFWQIIDQQLVGTSLTDRNPKWRVNLDSDQWGYLHSAGDVVVISSLTTGELKLVQASQQTVTPLPDIVSAFVYSPQSLLIQKNVGDQSTIYLANLDGSIVTKITEINNNFNIGFLRSNEKIYFYIIPTDTVNADLYQLDISKRQAVKVKPNLAYDMIASPAGNSIYYNHLDYVAKSSTPVTTSHLFNPATGQDTVLDTVLSLDQYLIIGDRLITKAQKDHTYATVMVREHTITPLTDYSEDSIDGFSAKSETEITIYSGDKRQTVKLPN